MTGLDRMVLAKTVGIVVKDAVDLALHMKANGKSDEDVIERINAIMKQGGLNG